MVRLHCTGGRIDVEGVRMAYRYQGDARSAVLTQRKLGNAEILLPIN